MAKTLGFIGLGIMGKPMAGHLIAAGHTVYLFTIEGVPADLVAAGGKKAGSAAEVAKVADIIFTMVPDTPHVEAVLFGDKGVAEGFSAGKIVVDMSSISPIETKKFAKKIEELGGKYHRRPGFGRRGRRQGRLADHHVRRRPGRVRRGEAALRKDGQEHHARRRQR